MRYSGISVTTPPKFEPVSLFELKQALKLCTSDTDEDALLSSLISAARVTVEAYQRRTIVQTSYKMNLDGWCDPILPIKPPLVSVSSVTYLDSAGDEQTLGTGLYNVDTASIPGRITKDYGDTYPTLYPVKDNVSVNYTAGYAKYAGTFDSWTTTSLVADFTGTIPQSGVVYIVNATGQYEVFGYRNAFNNSGVWTMTLPTSSTYSFSVDDVVEVYAIPEATRQAIIAIASDMYEHPGTQSEISLSQNKTAQMLLAVERVPEFY